jgi:hypothetical protein
MNRSLTTALWFFCALAVEGCVTHGRIGALPTSSDPTQAAKIIEIRKQRFVSAAGTIRIVLDGVPVYGIDGGEHVILRVPAGEHVVAAIESLAIKQSIVLDVQPKGRYYLRLQPIVGSGTLPTPVAAPQAKELLTMTTRVE